MKVIALGTAYNELEIRVLHVRDTGAVKRLHNLWAVWQENSDIRVLHQDHFVVITKPGGAAQGSAA